MSPLADITYYEDWWIQIIKGIVIFAVALQLLPLVIVGERKILGRFQMRYGPNRVGPFGLLQPLAEIVKFAVKQDIRPRTAIDWLYVIAPATESRSRTTARASRPPSHCAARCRPGSSSSRRRSRRTARTR